MKTITMILTLAIGLGAFLTLGASTADAFPPSKDPFYHLHKKKAKAKRTVVRQGRKPTIGVSIGKRTHRRLAPYFMRKRGGPAFRR